MRSSLEFVIDQERIMFISQTIRILLILSPCVISCGRFGKSANVHNNKQKSYYYDLNNPLIDSYNYYGFEDQAYGQSNLISNDVGEVSNVCNEGTG